MTQRSFQEQLAFGREVEKAVAGWLMSRGIRILPVYDYSGLGAGKAPKFAANIEKDSLVIPDLLGVKGGRSCFYEVKFKEHADWTRKTQRLETGIAKRLWDDYQQVELVSGIPVWLVFAHLREDEVRGERLIKLCGKERLYDGRKMGHSGMVFFPWAELKMFVKLSAIFDKTKIKCPI